mmetsp:Transcript_53729/g.156641  ORF Transcript_53729/g.156641 Transcript_53729/m.156641 type:complete len:85 (+) Transcript_53729:513-767(+)
MPRPLKHRRAKALAMTRQQVQLNLRRSAARAAPLRNREQQLGRKLPLLPMFLLSQTRRQCPAFRWRRPLVHEPWAALPPAALGD